MGKDDNEEIGDGEAVQTFKGSPEGRRQYDRDEAFDKKRTINRSETEGQGRTRPKKKVEGGSDVEDGEVEDAVDSDAEDEVDREEDHAELLAKMRNLRNKISSKVDVAAAEADAEGGETAVETDSKVRTTGRGRRKKKEEDGDWSLKKYDFEAPDIAETVKDHKPKFVKAPKRVFEKHDGYYSKSDESESGSSDEDKSDDKSKQ